MPTIQPSMDSPTSSLADWWNDALALVQRVNDRLRQEPPPSAISPRLRHGRRVLTNRDCVRLAGLAIGDEASCLDG